MFQRNRTHSRTGIGEPRIALFTDTFFEVNGAAHSLRKVAENLEKLNLPLDVYTYSDSEKVEVRGSVRIFTFNHRFSHNYYERLNFEFTPDFRIGYRWRQSLRENPYSVVHLATPGSMGVAGRRLAQKARLPMIGTYHTHLADYVSIRSKAPIKRIMKSACWRFMRWFYAPCEWVLCPTEGGIVELSENGFKNKLGIFTRGIDTDLYNLDKRDRTDLGIVTSYVGRVAPEKNVLVLPEIMNGVDSDLWVVGDGPERASLERQLQRAKFTGYLFGQDLATAYANSEILLFPSTTDTFGNVVLEAMASSVVPIVAKGPGPSEYVTDGKDAIICDGPGEMREAVESLLRNPAQLHTMRQEARSFAEKRSWRNAIDGLVNYYDLVTLS